MRAIAALAAVGVASATQARNLADSQQIQLIRDVTTQCRWASAKGSSFDLSAMTLAPGNYYNVNDMRDPNTRYLFNVCGERHFVVVDVSKCGRRRVRAGFSLHCDLHRDVLRVLQLTSRHRTWLTTLALKPATLGQPLSKSRIPNRQHPRATASAAQRRWDGTLLC